MRLLSSATLLLAAGCNFGGHTGPVEGEDRRELLNFDLHEGRTTRDNIRAQWGVPYAAYEGGRIWTYAMVPGRGGVLQPNPAAPDARSGFATWEDETYHLILIFEQDLLKSYRLLRIS